MNLKLWLLPCIIALFATLPAQSQEQEVAEYGDVEKIKELDSISDIAYEYMLNDNYAKSFEKNTELLKAAYEHDNPYYIHIAYSSLGYDQLSLEDTLQAQHSFKKSILFAKESKSKVAIANAEVDIAVVYALDQKTRGKSESHFENAIKAYRELESSSGLKAVYYNLAYLSIESENYEKMLGYLQELEDAVYQSNDPDVKKNNEVFLIYIATYRGFYHLDKKKYDIAEQYFQQAISLAAGEQHGIHREKIYELNARSYEEQGRYKEANEFQKLYTAQFKENENKRITNKTIAISADLKVSEYQKDIAQIELEKALEQEKVQNGKLINNSLLVISTILVILIVYLIRASKRRAELLGKINLQNKEYLKAKEESEKMAKSKSKFFSTVSHELRTPLYGVIGLSSILLEDITLKKHQKDLKALKFSADHLLALINDVLQINKIESKQDHYQEEVFNLRNLIDSIAISFEHIRKENHIDFNIHISDSLPNELKGNAMHLSQILINLVGNAMKFTQHGNVDLTLNDVTDSNGKIGIHFSIKDTGDGIAPEKQELIFDEFSQINSIHHSHQGTGLGLPIVSKLLKLFDAEISLDSTLGEGSTFSFTLQFDKSPSTGLKNTSKKHFVHDPELLRGSRILVVDDNRINQIVTKKILKKNHIHCELASDGQEAVQKVRKNSYDLVLMDVNMPVMDGLEATREIRKFSTIPIIALTAVEIGEMRQQITESGMNDIIVKPYNVDQLKEIILHNLQRSNTGVLTGA